jgi:hypothetical protein
MSASCAPYVQAWFAGRQWRGLAAIDFPLLCPKSLLRHEAQLGDSRSQRRAGDAEQGGGLADRKDLEPVVEE